MKFMIGILALLTVACAARAEEMRMAVTTSFANSGLAEILLPEIKADTGIDVRLLIVGTGQALRLGAAGDVDAVLVHSRAAEEAFVAAGNASHRREIMYNDFVLIGPSEDAAAAAAATTAVEALSAIAGAKASFVSRGDDSGTHKAEMTLWREADIAPAGRWYRSVGTGMGAALNMAAAMDAYVLSDRASWMKFGAKGDLELLFSGDPKLFNQYAYLPVNKEKHPHVNAEAAARLEDWLTGARAAELINGYQIGGAALFTHNAR